MMPRVQAADQQVRARFDLPIVRLSRILLDLAARAGVKGDSSITIPIELSQEDLAGLIGASRSTVARMLNKLRREGVIRTGYRSITITKAAWLNGAARTSSW